MLRTLARDADARIQLLIFLTLSEQAPLVSSCRIWHEWISHLSAHAAARLRACLTRVPAHERLYPSAMGCISMASSKWAQAVVTNVEPRPLDFDLNGPNYSVHEPACTESGASEARATETRIRDEAVRLYAAMRQLPLLRRLALHSITVASLQPNALTSLCREARHLEELSISLGGSLEEHCETLGLLLPCLTHAKSLRSLTITVRARPDPMPLLAEPGVFYARLEAHSFDALSALPDLRTFRLSIPMGGYLPSAGQVRTLARCARLEELDCFTSWRRNYDSRPVDEQLAEGLAILVEGPAGRSLRCLQLRCTTIASGVWLLLQRMPQLTVLTPFRWQLSAEEWRGLATFTGIEVIRLSELPESIDLACLLTSQAHSLKSLTLARTRTTLRTLPHNFEQLTNLTLCYCTLESLAGLEAVASRLTRLHLEQCRRMSNDDTHSALCPVDTLPAMPHVTSLTICEPDGEGLIRADVEEQKREAFAALASRFPCLTREAFVYRAEFEYSLFV